MKLPTDPTELEAMINEAIVNQTMAAADLNALITALESAENQLVVPTGESMPTLVSLEPSQSSVQQETAMAAQQEVQTVPKVQGVQAMQENQGVREAAQGQEMGGGPTAGLSTQGLAQALRQPPEAGPSLQNGRISLDGVSLEKIDPKDLELLKDIDPSELKGLEGLQDIRWAEIISSFQRAPVEENGLASNDNSQPYTAEAQETAKVMKREVIEAASDSDGGFTQQLSSAEAVQFPPGPLEEESHEPQPEGAHISLTNFGNGQRQGDPAQVEWASSGHSTEITVYQQELQYTADGLSALDEMDGAKLLEIQNAIQEFGGNEAFEQLLREINKDKPAPAVGTTEPTTEAFSPQSVPSLNGRPISVHPEISNVNVDQIPQEVVSVSIGRLLDTSNFNISSLSQATREQLMWLVNQLNQRQHHQDEYGDEGDEGDDDKKQARIREENRERKKRWREINQDRNKDNDLRCRVTKRAAKLYGAADTDEKRKWMETEFSKRKGKREAKERARYHDDRMSTSPCFGPYPQQHHNHSGGISAIFSPSLQPLSNRDSSENPTCFYEGAFRNRASSVAESTASSINDGDGTDSNGALRNFLSEPETALNLLQNSELMKLLSNNSKAMAFLQSIIECKKFESCSEDTTVRESIIFHKTSSEHINIGSMASADTMTLSAIPEARSEQQSPAQEITKPSIDISPYIDLSGEELEVKLAALDSDLAQKVLTELIHLQNGSEGEAIPEATGPPTTPIEAEVELVPYVQRILGTPGDHHHDVELDLALVNDKLINFSAEDFSFASMGSDDVSHSNQSTTDLGPEPGDINAKLLQALQGVFNINPPEEPVVSDPTIPPVPPLTSHAVNHKKRVASSREQPSAPRKRHQSSSTLLPELSPDATQTIATFLQKSGWDLQKLANPPAAPQTPSTRTYTTNTASRPTPNTTVPSPAYASSNTCSVSSARLTIPKPPAAMSAAAAHAASFGNSAAMNQRLMPPPAYRPSNLGIGYGGFSPVPTIPKKRPDDRIVKAMGFPPMLAGIKKTPS